MTKTNPKDPDTLDSLIESKEQTDKALAELADSLRNKLERLETVLGKESGVKNGGLTPPSNDPTTAESSVDVSPSFIELRISKQFGTWFLRVVAFVVMFLFIWGAMALLTSDRLPIPAPSPSRLVMTQQEADLVRGAIELVRDDVVGGTLSTTALTVQALSSMLPSSVRDAVLKELGTPSMDAMPGALDRLGEKLP